jgi:hypothetical protein
MGPQARHLLQDGLALGAAEEDAGSLAGAADLGHGLGGVPAAVGLQVRLEGQPFGDGSQVLSEQQEVFRLWICLGATAAAHSGVDLPGVR